MAGHAFARLLTCAITGRQRISPEAECRAQSEFANAHPWRGASKFMLFVFFPNFAINTLHHDPRVVSACQNVGIACLSISILFSGWLCDYVPRRIVHRIGTTRAASAPSCLDWQLEKPPAVGSACAGNGFHLVAP